MKQTISKFVILVLINLISCSLYAIDWKISGKWNEDKRSVSPSIPITVSVENDCLMVQSSTLRSDITVKITDDSTVVYEATFEADQTGCIRIDLNQWESGTYHLDLTNQWGDYLYGRFEL